MFEGFALERIDVGEAVLRVRRGGATIDSGHHMAEEAPDQLAAVLGEFFSGRASGAGNAAAPAT